VIGLSPSRLKTIVLETSMQRHLPILLFFFSVCVNSKCLSGDGITLRVLCYNIHHAEGVDKSLDVPRIARLIQSVNPDIVALQEVDRSVKRTNNVDQPVQLAKLTGMNRSFGANISLQGGEYGNALLTKFAITRTHNHLLPNFDNGEQRGVLDVGLKVPNLDVPLRFLVTHFDHRREERERIESAKMVNQLVAEHPDEPVILAGDLNAIPESETVKIIGNSWQQTNENPVATIPVDSPKWQIDFIFVRPRGNWLIEEFRVLDEATASDHRAIFTVIELK
jgi:endonuclease/exonuclease/phosphatase family metal-dependent hydrolase